MIVRTAMYFHKSKESNAELWRNLLTEHEETSNKDAARRFLYAGYEIDVEVEIDLESGDARAVALNGVKLQRLVRI